MPNRLRSERLLFVWDGATSKSKRLGACKLEIGFGDRIGEIVRYAEILRANAILMPQFQQSVFSSWIHGNLNRRINEKVNCETMFYDSDSEIWSVGSKSSSQDEQT